MKDKGLDNLFESWLEEASILEMQEKMESGELTSEQLTLMYIEMIRRKNPQINAVLELNPEALQIAKSLDVEREQKGTRSLLHGIPILLKDNMETNDMMHTSCGSLALQEFYAEWDAFLVRRLREDGAVILGKTNMTEWANFMSDRMPNGWSSRGGQVLNPYGMFEIGGSSSGAAASIAANMAVASIGTETTGSIIHPAVQNSLVGIKPTVGAISRTGIIPLSITQDTPGPLARTVEDAAIVFQTLVGYDSADSITIGATAFDNVDWNSLFDKEGLKDVRIGVARNVFQREVSTERMSLFEKALRQLKELGATIIDDVDLETMEDDLAYETLMHEFKASLNAYLGQTKVTNPIRTLRDVIEFNANHPRETLQYGQAMLEKIDRTSGTLTEQSYLEALQRNRHLAAGTALGKAFDKYQLKALVFPQNHGCSFGAAAGYPSVAVPASFAQNGEPFGITFYGKAYKEPDLIRYAYAFEQKVRARRAPS